MVAIVSDWLLPLSDPRRDKVVNRLVVVQSVAGFFSPVLNPTQINDKFESRWHQAWSEPKRFSIAPRLAISLAASGPFSPPWHLPEISNEIRGWFIPLQLPVWPKKGLRIFLQQFFPIGPVRYLPKANVTVTIHAQGPPNTDTSEFLVWSHFEPPEPADFEPCKVSITEV